MKRFLIFLVIPSFFFTIKSFAQEDVIFFQVGNENYIHLENFNSGTILEFYSNKDGGSQKSKFQLNEKGEGKIIFDKERTPSFLLNRLSSNNPAGNNKVQFLQEKEFVVDNINLDFKSHKVEFSWEARVGSGSSILFEVYRKFPNTNYTLVKSFVGIQGDINQTYVVDEAYNKNATYVLRIKNSDNKLRLESKEFVIASPPNIEVYPTIFNSNIYIKVPHEDLNSKYSIFGINGELLNSGILVENTNSIDTWSLPNGVYIVSIHLIEESRNFKVVKY